MPTAMVRAGGRGVDRLDDVVGRADLVGEQHRLVGDLGVHDDDAVGVLGAEGGDVLRAEALVDRAVAPPQEERRLLAVGLGEAAEVAARVPQPHLVEAVAHGDAGVAAEVLVGEEDDLVAAAGCADRRLPAAQRPLEHGPGVGRRAHGAAVARRRRP